MANRVEFKFFDGTDKSSLQERGSYSYDQHSSAADLVGVGHAVLNLADGEKGLFAVAPNGRLTDPVTYAGSLEATAGRADAFCKSSSLDGSFPPTWGADISGEPPGAVTVTIGLALVQRPPAPAQQQKAGAKAVSRKRTAIENASGPYSKKQPKVPVSQVVDKYCPLTKDGLLAGERVDVHKPDSGKTQASSLLRGCIGCNDTTPQWQLILLAPTEHRSSNECVLLQNQAAVYQLSRSLGYRELKAQGYDISTEEFNKAWNRWAAAG